MARDANGNNVTEGSSVKVLAIDPGLVNTLPPDELSYINSMIGKIYNVVEVSSNRAYIEAEWELGNGKVYTSKLAMAENEIELAS